MAKRKRRSTLTPKRKSTPAAPLFPHIPHLKKRAMLTTFAQCGQLRKSADAVHIDLRSHWRWLREDAEYQAAFKKAERMAADILEDRLITLGVEGYEETVWHKGKAIGKQTRYLPTLLMAAVNAALPEKYKFRQETSHALSPALQALHAQWEQQKLDAPQPTPSLPPVDAQEADYTPLAPAQPPPPATPKPWPQWPPRATNGPTPPPMDRKSLTFLQLDQLNGWDSATAEEDENGR